MQDFLTILFNFVVVAFAIVAILDFVLGLLKLWTVNSLQCCSQPEPQAPAPTPQQESERVTVNALQCYPPEPFKLPVVEDPWLTATADTTPTCCCHTTTALTAPIPLLMLPPARIGLEQINLATLGAEQLRKLCTAQNIKWRNAHGSGRHLKKAEMITMLAA